MIWDGVTEYQNSLPSEMTFGIIYLLRMVEDGSRRYTDWIKLQILQCMIFWGSQPKMAGEPSA